MSGYKPTKRTPERVAQIEARLVTLAQEIPGVVNPHGCSHDRSRDFKIHFEHGSSAKPTHGYFLEFEPDSQTIRAWPGGLPYDIPTVVKDHLGKKFPEAKYRFDRGSGVGGFHNWCRVTEDQLPE
ncbi:MAG: hypothetical protein AABW80_02655 [Nanoarchaeota archaeon]